MRLTRFVCQIPLAAAACLGVVVMPGCGSRDKTESAKASAEVKQVSAEVDQLNREIDSTLAALDQMVATRDGSDLRRSYNTFVSASKRVDEKSEDLAKRGIDMRERRDAYLDAWNRDIQAVQDPQIRETQQERLQAVEREFDQVTSRVNGIGDKMAQLRSRLSDLRIAFDHDLTAAGIKAMDRHIAKVHTDATEVQDELNDVTTRLARWSNSLKPAA